MEFGNNSTVSISPPESDGIWTFNVPYPAGSYDFNDVLYVRVKGSNNSWSITTILDEIASLSTEDELLKSTLLYPNPFQESIKISSQQNLLIENITIYSTLGKVVYKDNSNLQDLYLGFLPQGIYFLELSSKNGKATFKIVKK